MSATAFGVNAIESRLGPGVFLYLQGGFFASNRFTQRVLAAQRELQRTSPVASQPLGMHILLICA